MLEIPPSCSTRWASQIALAWSTMTSTRLKNTSIAAASLSRRLDTGLGSTSRLTKALVANSTPPARSPVNIFSIHVGPRRAKWITTLLSRYHRTATYNFPALRRLNSLNAAWPSFRNFAGSSPICFRIRKIIALTSSPSFAHLTAAMQELSKESNEQYVYQHTGWTQIGGQPVYLHAGGGLGADGPVTDLLIELDHVLRRFTLPEPPRGRELVRAIRASLDMLEVSPDRVTIPIYCAIWRAVLGIVDVSIHLSGQTGSGKSQIAALAQQHFGAGLDAKHLPANWDSTANALQAICFHAKNSLVVVDDFVPKGSASDVARMHREADRLLRAQGNHAGRQRMSADKRIRPARVGLLSSLAQDQRHAHAEVQRRRQGRRGSTWTRLGRQHVGLHRERYRDETYSRAGVGRCRVEGRADAGGEALRVGKSGYRIIWIIGSTPASLVSA